MFLNKSKKFEFDEKISLYVFFSLMIRALNITIRGVFNLTSLLNQIITILFLGFYLFLFLFIFVDLNKKQKKEIIIVEVIGFALLSLSCIRYLNYATSIFVEYSWLIISLLPSLYFILQISNCKILYNILHKYSYVISLICSILYFFHTSKLSVNMVFSYTLLLPYLFHINGFLKEKSKIDLGFLILETYYMLTYASRGTIICSLIFVILRIFMNCNKNSRKVFIGILSTIVLISIIVYYSGILSNLNLYFLQNGKYYRTLDLIANGNFFYNNGRFDIYYDYFNYILEKPIFGWGIGADKVVGIYPHNIIIELIFNFGVISLFLFSFISVAFFRTIKNLNEDNRDLLLIFVCTGLIPLFFSATYLEWLPFWILLGLLFNSVEYGK